MSKLFFSKSSPKPFLQLADLHLSSLQVVHHPPRGDEQGVPNLRHPDPQNKTSPFSQVFISPTSSISPHILVLLWWSFSLTFLSARADKALQDIVYKVVPGLYRTEMQNRVKFYTRHPDAEPANSEDAGEVADSLFFSPEDDISMSIEYFDNIR